MRMPIRRVIVGAIAGVGLAGLAALADSNQKHATTGAATAQADRKIKYTATRWACRTSHTPKKDSMGMDYTAGVGATHAVVAAVVDGVPWSRKRSS